jgi:hypothetical protein
MAGINKKTKTNRYSEWMKMNHVDAKSFAEQREEFIKNLRELSSL